MPSLDRGYLNFRANCQHRVLPSEPLLSIQSASKFSAAPFFDFDALTDTDLGDVFAEHSVSGDWIAFHGTSSVNENEIDNTGIHGSQISTEKEIADLVSIYKSMNWDGRSSGGFGVLASFTWQRTIGVPVRPVYLSHYAERCLLYSTKGFAGGETARAIRIALEDLVDYTKNEDLRQEHYNFQRYECEDLVSKNAIPTPSRLISIGYALSWPNYSHCAIKQAI